MNTDRELTEAARRDGLLDGELDTVTGGVDLSPISIQKLSDKPTPKLDTYLAYTLSNPMVSG